MPAHADRAERINQVLDAVHALLDGSHPRPEAGHQIVAAYAVVAAGATDPRDPAAMVQDLLTDIEHYADQEGIVMQRVRDAVAPLPIADAEELRCLRENVHHYCLQQQIDFQACDQAAARYFEAACAPAMAL